MKKLKEMLVELRSQWCSALGRHLHCCHFLVQMGNDAIVCCIAFIFRINLFCPTYIFCESLVFHPDGCFKVFHMFKCVVREYLWRSWSSTPRLQWFNNSLCLQHDHTNCSYLANIFNHFSDYLKHFRWPWPVFQRRPMMIFLNLTMYSNTFFLPRLSTVCLHNGEIP